MPPKRKRDSLSLHLSLAQHPQHIPGPLLVVYPAIQPPPSTPFKAYARKKQRSDNDDTSQDIIVAGETPHIEFATNEDESKRAAQSGCRYLLAVHNKRTGALSLLPAQKSPHILKRTVKALKSIKPTEAPSTTQYLQARTALGETFGTKKAKAAIRAKERNRVDVGAMEGVMDYVIQGIEKGAQGLMTADEAKEAVDNNRLIPPFSATATDPADIYPILNIIPEPEFKALSVTPFDGPTSDKDLFAVLPHSRSQWVNAHVRIWAKSDSKKERKTNLKLLLYISALFAFRNAITRPNFNADQIRERLTGLPGIVVDGLFSRFTEKARGSSSYQATSATKTLLLTNIFALCLKLDNFATNTEVLCQDLNMAKDQVNQLFKSLGCKVSTLGERERARLGISESGDTKFAVLSAPLTFPKQRMRKRN